MADYKSTLNCGKKLIDKTMNLEMSLCRLQGVYAIIDKS